MCQFGISCHSNKCLQTQQKETAIHFMTVVSSGQWSLYLGLTHQAFPLLLDGVTVGADLDEVVSTLDSLLAMANIFLCFWDSLVGTGECLMLVLTLHTQWDICIVNNFGKKKIKSPLS